MSGSIVSNKLINTLEGHTDWIYSVAISPDNTKIVSGSLDRSIRVWNIESGNLINTLEGHTYWVISVAINPDNKKIVSRSYDNTIKIWDIYKRGLHTKPEFKNKKY